MNFPNDPVQPKPPNSKPSFPEAEISAILGLVELLKSKGGREDIYKLAAELKMEFGETLKVIRGAELLNLVNTPGGDVVLEELGVKLCKARVNQKKKIISKELERIPVFQKVVTFLQSKSGKEVSKAEIQEYLAELIPNEDVERSFSHLINWGRYAELFGYNDNEGAFYLDTEEED